MHSGPPIMVYPRKKATREEPGAAAGSRELRSVVTRAEISPNGSIYNRRLSKNLERGYQKIEWIKRESESGLLLCQYAFPAQAGPSLDPDRGFDDVECVVAEFLEAREHV